MSVKVIIILVVTFIYLTLAVCSIVTLFQLKKISPVYKGILFVLSIIFPPLGFGLTMYTKWKSNKKKEADPPKKDKPGDKKK
jgi:hypothetical protein